MPGKAVCLSESRQGSQISEIFCAALLSLTVFAYRVFFSGNCDNSTFEFKEMKITGRKSEIVFLTETIIKFEFHFPAQPRNG